MGLKDVDVAVSAAVLDLLLGRAVVLSADGDELIAQATGEAAGIAMLLAAENPPSGEISWTGLESMDLPACIEAVALEVDRWGVELELAHPAVTELSVMVGDLWLRLGALAGSGAGPV